MSLYWLNSPSNVFRILQINDDLYSEKLSALFYKLFSSDEKDNLIKFYFTLLFVYSRPKDWEKKIHKYIDSIKSDSVYLSNLQNALTEIDQYYFITDDDKGKIKKLIQMCHTRYAHKNDEHWFDKVEATFKGVKT